MYRCSAAGGALGVEGCIWPQTGPACTRRTGAIRDVIDALSDGVAEGRLLRRRHLRGRNRLPKTPRQTSEVLIEVSMIRLLLRRLASVA